MYCNQCGKQNPPDGKFCQHCGATLQKENEPMSTEVQELKQIVKTKSDLLWDKFAEIHDSQGEKKEKFNSFASTYIWELTERLAVNAFESFIKDNIDELNAQPYKTIEALKNAYILSVVGGYRLWQAEALLDKHELNRFKSFSMDDFIEAWKNYDFDNAFKAISDEMATCITQYNNFRFNNFLESMPEAKNLSNATIEKLKSSLIFQIANGRHAGDIENNFRK